MKTVTNKSTMKKRTELAVQGIKKLSREELSALLSTTTDLATSRTIKPVEPGMAKKLAKLKEVIAEMEAKMAERFKVKWMAADGSTFDNYNEYSNYQWGTNFPPSEF